MIIFYDNYCPNCTRFAKLVEKLDWFKFIKIQQLRNNQHIGNVEGIDINTAEKQMASFDGKWNYGYLTLFKIFIRIPLFWVFIPLFWILNISNVGQYLYMQLAVNRKIIPLHCSDETCEIK